MPIDYRYHIGSFVAIFVALLLGILIGIGLAPNPEELNRVVAGLKEEYRTVSRSKEEEISQLRDTNRESEMLAREAVAALVRDRLAGKRVALILGHNFGSDPLPENLRAVVKQAGATVTSTSVVTLDFVSLPAAVKQKVAQRLNLYPPPGVHFRSLIAEAVVKDLVRGRPDLIRELHSSGLLTSTADSDYEARPDLVLIVGGLPSASEGAPDRIDLAMIEELTQLGVRVVGAEPREAAVSVMPIYNAAGIPTVDNADTAAGRLSVVLALAGADGHFGVKDTAESFLPPIPR